MSTVKVSTIGLPRPLAPADRRCCGEPTAGPVPGGCLLTGRPSKAPGLDGKTGTPAQANTNVIGGTSPEYLSGDESPCHPNTGTRAVADVAAANRAAPIAPLRPVYPTPP